jgi:hypothetical protein
VATAVAGTVDDLPIRISFESGPEAVAPSASATDDLARRYVQQPAADALKPPAVDPNRPRDVDAAAIAPEDAASTQLRVVIGENVKMLRCTQDELTGFVAMAYIAGGFSTVIEARQAIEQGIAALKGKRDEAQKLLAGSRPRDLYEPASGRARFLALPSTAVQGAMRERPEPEAAQRALNEVADSLSRVQSAHVWYDEYFRRAWNAIAINEEDVLRKYDTRMLKVFQDIAKRNRDLAEAEWHRLAPVSTDYERLDFKTATLDDFQYLELTPAVLDDLMPAKSGTKSDTEKKDSEKNDAAEKRRQDAINELWKKTSDLAYLKNVLRQTGFTARQLNKNDTPERVEERRREARCIWANWIKARKKIAKSYPTLLLLYYQAETVAESETLREKFERRVVDALLMVRDEADRLLGEDGAFSLWTEKETLRLTPVRVESDREVTYDLSDSELNKQVATRADKKSGRRDARMYVRMLLKSEHKDAARRFGLIIPASEVAGAMLTRDKDRRRNTGWIHTPVSHELHEIGTKGDVELAPYSRIGALEYAAVCHVRDLVAEQRASDKEWETLGLKLMWGAALVLSPATEGLTLVGAAFIQAAYSAHEIFETVDEYRSASGLAALSMSAIEEATWRRPSTVLLVVTIVGDVGDIADFLTGPQVLAVWINLALYAVSLVPGTPSEPEPPRKTEKCEEEELEPKKEPGAGKP